jgi:hypothetical protein
MHAWDQPAEVLLELGPKSGARLVMPHLGESIEPAHEKRIEPWWRGIDTMAREPAREAPVETGMLKAMPWPID